MTGGEFRAVLLRERVLAALKQQPNDVVHAETVARAVGISTARAKRALGELARLNYVEELDRGRFTITETGYDHALDLVDFKDE